MDDAIMKGREEQPSIWLKHTTQLSVNGRNHTLELNVPVPLDASTELREQLIRNAEASMDQMVDYVERRASQAPGSQRRYPTQPGVSVSQSASPPASRPAPPARALPAIPPARETLEVEPSPATRQASSNGDWKEEEQRAPVPAMRQQVNMASMGEQGDTLSIPQFLQIVREECGIKDPRQAMDLLKVRTLSGTNLREALVKLRQLTGHDMQEASSSGQQESGTGSRHRSVEKLQPPTPSAYVGEGEETHLMPGIAPLREPQHAYKFDEEEEMEEEEEDELALELEEDDEEDEQQAEQLPELTVQERVRAKGMLNKLKEARGTSSASSSRLSVLRNVTSHQISDEQLRRLIQGIWGVSKVNQLKIDQVEMLISWAKEDSFDEREVEAVLALSQL